MSRLSLRYQLLFSYLFMLGTSLTVITVSLLVFLGTRPAPAQPTYQRLDGLMQGLNLPDLLIRVAPRQPRLTDTISQITTALDEFARIGNVRVLWIASRGDGSQFVLYDSQGTYASQDVIATNTDALFVGRTGLQRFQVVMTPGKIYGSFNDPDGTEWLFGGISHEFIVRQNIIMTTLLLAEQRPTMTLQETLRDFSNDLLPPLLQAGIVGFVVAVLLAYLISRGLARPLQSLAQGAQAVAKGDYEHRVKETGPQEIRAVAGAFNHMSAEVRSAQQSQRDFLANVSHDLKTPLTSIQGYSQAIIDGAAKNAGDAAQIIYDEAARLNRMVTQLTDLARLEAGRLSMQTSALDVGEIAVAIGQRLAVVARKKQVNLRLKAAPMPHIAGDGDRLAQVLTNLLSNAIKFTPAGGEVLLKTQVSNGGVEIIVQDSGIGIPAEDLPRIFERFYQVDKTRGPQRGTGLGLAITREIVEAHGGTIQVYSAGENQGTLFTIWLPSPQLSTIISRGKGR
jgi:signal transduction histidine kinase